MTAVESETVVVERREYWWSLLAAIVLSAATLASAWCGYQSSSWGSVYSSESRTANTARMESSRQAAIADRQLMTDLMLFTSWVEAEILEQELIANEISDRFLPHFKPAFEIWRNGPITHGHLPDGNPFDLDEYQLPSQQAADEATARADTAILRADEASEISGRYVLATVLFASVLFLAGIASKLSQPRISHSVIVLAALSLFGAITTVLSLPITW